MTSASPQRISPARRGWTPARLGLALALLTLLSATPGAAGTVGASGIPRGAWSGSWVLTRNSVTLVAHADPALALRLFDRPDAWVLSGWGGASSAMSWPSFSSFAEAVAHGTIPAGVRAVMYDPEGWAVTPTSERQDPGASMKAFSELAHAQGYVVILTPHPDLTTVPGAVCLRRQDESMEDAYLRCRIPSIAGRYADILDVQAQFLEADPGRYARVVGVASRQARAANPDVVVVSQLSTTFAADPGVLYRASSAVRGLVDGHYLGMPNGFRAEVAMQFLRMVDGEA